MRVRELTAQPLWVSICLFFQSLDTVFETFKEKLLVVHQTDRHFRRIRKLRTSQLRDVSARHLVISTPSQSKDNNKQKCFARLSSLVKFKLGINVTDLQTIKLDTNKY